MSNSDTLHTDLLRWLEDGDRAALESAHMRAVQMKGIDVGALLEWIEDNRSDATRTELALRRMRHAVGLPVVAGPVCRPRVV
jgi:hypothetical protein